MPYLTIVCVWPPHTSMIVHGRVTIRAIAVASFRADSASRYSSRYFMPAPLRTMEFPIRRADPFAPENQTRAEPRPRLSARGQSPHAPAHTGQFEPWEHVRGRLA